jgi:hypothetical protein
LQGTSLGRGASNLAQIEKREYSISLLLFGNLAVLLWILLGAVSCWLFSPFAALGFVALASFVVFYKLGKKGCVNCFWCKTCTIGMGKLPYLFYTKSSIENLNINRKALKLFPYVYLLLSVVPIAITLVSIVQSFSVYSVVLLAALAAFSILTGSLRRKLLIGH